MNLYEIVENQSVSRFDAVGLRPYYFAVMTFIPMEYIDDPIEAIYRGDGHPSDFSFFIKRFRTRHEIGFDPDSFSIWQDEKVAITTDDRQVGTSIRYRRLNMIEKGFTGAPKDKFGFMYKGEWWVEDARGQADASGVKVRVSSIPGECPIVLEITASIGDPVGPPGVPKVDYKMEVEFTPDSPLGDAWKIRVRAEHDGFPSYAFFHNFSAIWTHSASGHSPLELTGLFGRKRYDWKDL